LLAFFFPIVKLNVTIQVQSSGFTVQWLFAEPLTVKCGFFMSRLTGLGMDNGSWLQVEPLNCEPLAQTRLPSGGQA
jgi:hypothetical protein